MYQRRKTIVLLLPAILLTSFLLAQETDQTAAEKPPEKPPAASPAAKKASSSKQPSAPSAPSVETAKKIQITLGELFAARQSLDKLFTLDLPIRSSVTLSKTMKAVRSELEIFDEKRVALIKKYGKIDPVTGNGTVEPENAEKFNTAYKELIDIKVELTVTRITLASFGEGAKLSAFDLVRLEPFVVPLDNY